ncbi:hypothetical protein N9N28_17760, partial [Rubripirellula amarantea]|nr:hypothetical protein [Rubripirellula amarantea]
VGVKLIENKATHLQFLTQLIPEMTCVGFCTLIVVVYRKSVHRNLVYLAGGFLILNALLTILFGSKGGVLMLVFSVATIFLTRFRDMPIKRGRLVMIVLPTILIVGASIVTASTMRWATRKQSNLSTGVARGWDRLEIGSELKDGLLMVSKRASAFDAVRIAQIQSPTGAMNSFNPFNVAFNLVGRLIPGVSPRSMTISKAVAIYYFNKPEGFGASLGLFPTLKLMFGRYSLISIFLYGLLTTLLFSQICQIRDPDIRTTIQYVFLFATTRIIMSGAFDHQLSICIVQIVHIVGLAYLLARFSPREKNFSKPESAVRLSPRLAR